MEAVEKKSVGCYCPHCYSVFNMEDTSSRPAEDGGVHVSCPICYHDFPLATENN